MKYIAILLAMIVSVSFLAMVQTGTASSPSTLYVGGSGPGNYTTIQGAINASADGDTIQVYPGLYRENLLVNKEVIIVGNNATIDGGGAGDAVQINANNTFLSGFYIINSSSDAGVLVNSCHVDIQECTIAYNFYGIYACHGTCDVRIYHNNFVNNTYNAWDKGSNIWDDGAMGNYWSDYGGADDNKDGIGDLPHDIGGGTSRDNYPLMYPYGLPAAVFGYETNGLEAVFNGSFSVDYDGVIENYSWNFGDGNISYGKETNHSYNGSGVYEVTLAVKDNNGRTGTFTKGVIIDTEKPLTTCNLTPSFPNGDNGWYVSNVWFNLTASDTLSGVNYTKYKIDNGGWEYYENDTVSLTGDGTHFVRYYSVDKYGNEEDVKVISVKIDKTAPYTLFDQEENESYWYRTDAIITLDGYDNMSGVISTHYRVNGGAFSTYTGPFNITSEGINTLECFSQDNAGNVEPLKSTKIRIDKTAPSLEVSSPKKSYLYVMGREILPLEGFDNFAIVIGGIDVSTSVHDSVSGIQKVEFYTDSALRYTDNSAPYTWNWNETAIGPYTIKVKAYDMAGNMASAEVPVMVFNVIT